MSDIMGVMTSEDTPRDLASWIEQRREELQLTVEELAIASGAQRSTIYTYGQGRVPRAKTRRGLEEALRWEPGSVRAILDGGTPTPLPLPGETLEEDARPDTWSSQRIRDAIALVEMLRGAQEANALLRDYYDKKGDLAG